MAKLRIATAATFSFLFLSACGGGQPAAAENSTVEAQANDSGDLPAAEPAPPAPVAPGNDSAEPVPPPDAVSHPDGYLPPAPSEPEPKVSNAPDSPATEDQYIRNGR